MANQIVVSAGAKVRNLSGVLTATSGVVSFLPIDVSLGIPQLDVNGKILVSQLPNSVMEYKGTWNAATNTPTLANGTGNQGDVYLCNVAGTVDFGAGPIAFFVGDQVIYSGSIWQRASGATGTVTSVAVTESGDSLNITGSPITTSGTINIGFNGTNLQYVNGAGNLTTFPDLTGFVPYTGATANVNIGTHSFIANNGTYNSEMSPSLFGVENAAGTIFGLLEYNKLTLTNSTGAGSIMEVNAQGLIFPDASVQISSYTDAKARLALSFVAGSGAYNSTTGVITIPTNNNQITNGAGYTTNVGTVTSVAATGGTGISITGSPITTSGTITITNTAPDQTVALTASTGISVTGTYPNFTITNTSPSSGGTVTSVAALTIGTTGTDLSSSVATGTTTPVITLNVPTASATNRGALASADWSTFNSKQGTITLTTTGTSGAATFSANTLNIPNYGSALSGYLPLTGGTLTGALSGTSANFSSSVTATGTINAIGTSPLFRNTDNSVGNVFDVLWSVGGSYWAYGVTGFYDATNSQKYDEYKGGASGFRKLYTNGTLALTLASTGAATFSSSIASSISGSGDNAFLLATGTGTGARYSYIANDGAAAIFGIEKAAGGAILGGSSAYATVLYSNNATPLQLGTNQLVRLTITSGGNVGIGTSSPSAVDITLNVKGITGATNASIVAESFDATKFVMLYSGVGGGDMPSIIYAGDLRFGNGTKSTSSYDERMRITSGGTVLIGTATDYTSKLVIIPSSNPTSSTGANNQISIGETSNNTGYCLKLGYINTGGGYQGSIQSIAGGSGSTLFLNASGGNVLIGTTTNATGLLQVNGTIYATGFYESSDIRFKNIIETNPNVNVLGIDVIKFTRKDNDTNQVRYGYSAQQIQSILPDAVTGTDFLNVNYLDVHTLKIAQLEKEIKELKAKLN